MLKLVMVVEMPSELALMLIMKSMIASELVVMAISMEDRSGAAPPPPIAIAAELVVMAL